MTKKKHTNSTKTTNYNIHAYVDSLGGAIVFFSPRSRCAELIAEHKKQVLDLSRHILPKESRSRPILLWPCLFHMAF